MSRWALLPALALCALAAALFAPALARDRELVAETPSPRPLFNVTPVEIPPGEELCVSDVTIPVRAQELRFQVATLEGPGPALDIRLQAPRYDERLTVPGGYAEGALIVAPMPPPPGDRLGRVCITQAGTAPITLTGTTEERTLSRPQGTLAAKPIEPDVYLAFYERGRGSAFGHIGDIVDRMSAFRPVIVGPWLLWPLLALVLVGVPGGVLWALLRAARA